MHRCFWPVPVVQVDPAPLPSLAQGGDRNSFTHLLVVPEGSDLGPNPFLDRVQPAGLEDAAQLGMRPGGGGVSGF